jgi:hypothetical protein
MNSFSLYSTFHVLFGIGFLITNVMAAPSIEEMRSRITLTVRHYQNTKKMFYWDDQLAKDLRDLDKSSSVKLFEMVNSFNDINANELIFWCLRNRDGVDYFTFTHSDNYLFSSFLFSATELGWRLFELPCDDSKKEIFDTIEIIIRIVKKNIKKARKQMIIYSILANKMKKMKETMINWEYVIINFSIDPLKKTINFAAFSHLFDQIMGFSLRSEYKVDNEKYYLLFKVYLTLLWKNDLKGLFKARIRNLDALVCYFYLHWEGRDYHETSFFWFFEDFQKDRKRTIVLALEKMKNDIFKIFEYRKSWNLYIPFYSTLLVFKRYERGKELKKHFPRDFCMKLKVAAFLETQLLGKKPI